MPNANGKEIEKILINKHTCAHTHRQQQRKKMNKISFFLLIWNHQNYSQVMRKKNEKEEEENYYWINKNFGWKFLDRKSAALFDQDKKKF